MESFLDFDLLAEADRGNRDAIRQICEEAAQHLEAAMCRRAGTERDLLDLLAMALEDIAGESTPNRAFGWSKSARGRWAPAVALLKAVAKEHSTEHDELTSYVIDVLERIAGGLTPDSAFCWISNTRGRPLANLAYRNWDIRTTVQELMKTKPMATCREACHYVSSDQHGEFLLTGDQIVRICRGLTTDTPLPLPEGIFPVSRVRYRDRRFPVERRGCWPAESLE